MKNLILMTIILVSISFTMSCSDNGIEIDESLLIGTDHWLLAKTVTVLENGDSQEFDFEGVCGSSGQTIICWKRLSWLFDSNQLTFFHCFEGNCSPEFDIHNYSINSSKIVLDNQEEFKVIFQSTNQLNLESSDGKTTYKLVR